MIKAVKSNSYTYPIYFYDQSEDTPRQSGSSTSEDTFYFSKESQIMSNALSGLDIESSSTRSIYLKDLESILESKQEALSKELEQVMRENRIDDVSYITLSVNDNNTIQVEDDQPQKQQIEKILGQNPQISQELREIIGLSVLVNSDTKHNAFAKQYAINPYTAAAQYNDTIKKAVESSNSVTFTLSQQENPTKTNSQSTQLDLLNTNQNESDDTIEQTVSNNSTSENKKLPFIDIETMQKRREEFMKSIMMGVAQQSTTEATTQSDYKTSKKQNGVSSLIEKYRQNTNDQFVDLSTTTSRRFQSAWI